MAAPVLYKGPLGETYVSSYARRLATGAVRRWLEVLDRDSEPAVCFFLERLLEGSEPRAHFAPSAGSQAGIIEVQRGRGRTLAIHLPADPPMALLRSAAKPDKRAALRAAPLASDAGAPFMERMPGALIPID
jgi:hypothetical protein